MRDPGVRRVLDAAWEIIDQLATKYTGVPYPEGKSASWPSSSPGGRASVSAEQPRVHPGESVPAAEHDDRRRAGAGLPASHSSACRFPANS
jgi:hypothetical protein